MTPPPLPRRLCDRRGRSFSWRRKWARDWANVRYCSNRCRRHGLTDHDAVIEERILDRFADRTKQPTTYQGEIARAIPPEDWPNQVERVREAGRRLVSAGRIEMLQDGRPVDLDRARRTLCLRLRSGP